MRSVGIKTLKNKLSEYVRIAAAGETVLICDRDRVVAEMHPPAAARAETPSDAALLHLLREGVLSAPVDADAPLPERRPNQKLATLLEEIEEFRASR